MYPDLLNQLSTIQVLNTLKSIFKEKRCPACRRVHLQSAPLCPKCMESLPSKPHKFCRQCGQEIREHGNEYSCRHCVPGQFRFTRIYYSSIYDGLLKELIRDWKFNQKYELGIVFEEMMKANCPEMKNSANPELIVPVPLHRTRLRQRGFNQSRILAKAISKQTGIPFTDKALKRIRKTTPQSSLSGSDRKENLLQAFSATPDLVQGRRILVVDDVFTTGSTIDECAAALLESGAAMVDCMILARTLI